MSITELECLGIPQEELESVAMEGKVWADLFWMLPHCPKQQKDWMNVNSVIHPVDKVLVPLL